jgi:hypothetical protein
MDHVAFFDPRPLGVFLETDFFSHITEALSAQVYPVAPYYSAPAPASLATDLSSKELLRLDHSNISVL